MDPHVSLERVCEVSAEGRVRRLVLDELDLAREGQPAEVVPAREVVHRADAGGAPLRADERIGGEQLARHGPDAVPLMQVQVIGRQRLQRAIEHGRGSALQRRSLKRWILPVAVLGSSPANSIQRGYL